MVALIASETLAYGRTPPAQCDHQSQTRHIHVTPDRGVFDSNNWGEVRVSLNQAVDSSQTRHIYVTPDRGVFDSNNRGGSGWAYAFSPMTNRRVHFMHGGWRRVSEVDAARLAATESEPRRSGWRGFLDRFRAGRYDRLWFSRR
jgi:hypothetical protein